MARIQSDNTLMKKAEEVDILDSEESRNTEGKMSQRQHAQP
jgi:hypothetical protein